MSRLINLIAIHCAATPNGVSLFAGSPGTSGFRTPIQRLDEMHRQRSFKRTAAFRQRQNPELTSVGYHFVIYTTGTVVTGRHLDEVGAHVQGHNANSIGICLIGTDAFTAAQWEALGKLVDGLRKTYPAARVCGHRDLSPDKNGDGKITSNEWLKTCPGFDVATWLRNDKTPESKNVWVAK